MQDVCKICIYFRIVWIALRKPAEYGETFLIILPCSAVVVERIAYAAYLIKRNAEVTLK